MALSLPWNFGSDPPRLSGIRLRGTGPDRGPTRRGGRLTHSGPCLPTKKHGWHRVATSTPRGCPWKNYLSVLVSAPRRTERYNYSSHVVAPRRITNRTCCCESSRIESPPLWSYSRSSPRPFQPSSRMLPLRATIIIINRVIINRWTTDFFSRYWLGHWYNFINTISLIQSEFLTNPCSCERVKFARFSAINQSIKRILL